jgi:hypothetical protein
MCDSGQGAFSILLAHDPGTGMNHKDRKKSSILV